MRTKHSGYYSPYEKAQKERKGNENGKNRKWGGTEQYLKPEMEVIKFENEDVIVTSGCSTEQCYLNTSCSGANCYLDGVPSCGFGFEGG